MAVIYRNIAAEAATTGQAAASQPPQPQIVGISGLFAYNSSGDLVPVSTTTGSDSVFELNGGGDLQPKA